MKKLFSIVLLFIALSSTLYASQSTITESEGNACMGDDKSRKQTEEAALTAAKKKAVEYAATYVTSETNIKNFVLERDLVSAYANATVKIIQEVGKSWYKDPSSGDCYKITIKSEVVPDAKAMTGLSKSTAAAEDPSAPLSVKVWTDKKEYRSNEKIKVYIKGNKPFYARIIYKDAGGELVQLLPNPYRGNNYFNGGTIYELPSGDDKFDLEVSPPFGEESIVIYAGTSPLGEINTQMHGGVYQVKTQANDIPLKTRGVKLMQKMEGKAPPPSAVEFFEEKITVRTGKAAQ
jgi:hypothetical protein